MRVEVPHKGAKVYIYTRVSTEMQVEGYSLDAQKVEILKEVRRHDMVVAGEYTDEGRSGKSIVGRDGYETKVPIDLDQDEVTNLHESANTLRSVIEDSFKNDDKKAE